MEVERLAAMDPWVPARGNLLPTEEAWLTGCRIYSVFSDSERRHSVGWNMF